MKKSKYCFVLLMLLTIGLVAFGSTFLYVKFNKKNGNNSQENIIVMTSCNPVYMATVNILQDVEGVTVSNLSQPTTGCLHEYILTTEDMKNLSKADVLIVNGGGMEGYLDDVIAAYPQLPIIDSSLALEGIVEEHEHGESDEHDVKDGQDGHDEHVESDEYVGHDGHNEHNEHDECDVENEHDEYDKHDEHDVKDGLEEHDVNEQHEDYDEHEDHENHENHEGYEDHEDHEGHHHDHGMNSHFWLSYNLYEKQVQEIADRLSERLPESSELIEANAADYIHKIDSELGIRVEELNEKLSGSNVVLLHDAYEYTATDLGMTVAGCMDLDEERQVSAGEVAELTDAITAKQVELIFAEEDYGAKVGDLLSKQTGAKVVFLQTMVHGAYQADDYTKLMLENYDAIEKAL